MILLIFYLKAGKQFVKKKTMFTLFMTSWYLKKEIELSKYIELDLLEKVYEVCIQQQVLHFKLLVFSTG